MSEVAEFRMKTLRNNGGLLFGTIAFVGVVCLITVVTTFAHRPASQSASTDTTQMERFARLLGHAVGIAPYTVRETEELMRTSYDCDKMYCDPAIAVRNRAARSKLRYLLAASSLPDPDAFVAAMGRRLLASKNN